MYLDHYTDPARPYAYATYDQAAAHDGPITATDVLMVNLLSLRFSWREVLPLFTTLDDSRVLTSSATHKPYDVRQQMRADIIANREWMEALAPRSPVRGGPMPLTRMADILIWMSGGDTGPAEQ